MTIDMERERLIEQELLILDVTERITEMLERQGVSKAELARRLGHTRGHVTQLLDGSRNMTLRTVADVAFVLGNRIRVGYEPAHRHGRFPGEVYPIQHGQTRHASMLSKYRQWQRQDEHAPYGRSDWPPPSAAADTPGPYERVGAA